MDITSFEEKLGQCEALKNYRRLKRETEKMREDFREISELKVERYGKTLDLKSLHQEVKRLNREIFYGKTFLGLEKNLNKIPPEILVKVLINIAKWLDRMDWKTITHIPATAPRLLYLAINQIQERYKLNLDKPEP